MTDVHRSTLGITTVRELKDYAGQRFGRWTAIRFVRFERKKQYWVCRCDCGTEVEKTINSIVTGASRSCGCLTTARRLDLSGRRFGKLKAVRYAGLAGKVRKGRWLFECDCGVQVEMYISNVVRKDGSKSCGCDKNVAVIHGLSRTPEYKVWKNMRRRCSDVLDKAYPNYGGRGITVCAAWADVKTFCLDVGGRPTPKHTLDRIDNDGHYSCGKCEECVQMGWPSNCRWATRYDQSINRRNTSVLTYHGVSMPLQEWAKNLNMAPSCLQRRIHRNWPIEIALFAPLLVGKRRDYNDPAVTAIVADRVVAWLSCRDDSGGD